MIAANGVLKNNGAKLIAATKSGWLLDIESVLDDGVCVDARDENGQTASMWAAAKGQIKALKLLLDRGADVDSRTPHGFKTVLMYAAVEGQTRAIELLLRRGADVEARDWCGQTALFYAIIGDDHAEAVELLLDYGADFEIEEARGATPLETACTLGQIRSVEALLRRGVDPFAVLKCGESVVDKRRRGCYSDEIDEVLKKNALKQMHGRSLPSE